MFRPNVLEKETIRGGSRQHLNNLCPSVNPIRWKSGWNVKHFLSKYNYKNFQIYMRDVWFLFQHKYVMHNWKKVQVPFPNNNSFVIGPSLLFRIDNTLRPHMRGGTPKRCIQRIPCRYIQNFQHSICYLHKDIT